ncbi:MAG TPA: transcriptional regulator NrdR [Anaerolineae bacterium]|nr:transcriptional regulator NrdR [Anaerolineae bacterium]HOQ99641.1 transcriptional regulator NrdR [Anaerolineae bacterium]HPL26998.1 transcriptional regulator NrdR [Anaerolineae bacterium]
MPCPFCGAEDSRVVDTRQVGDAIRRRRECGRCHQRFTTYERVAKASIMVVKRDGRREAFDREKLYEGVRRACAKRPISTEALDQFVDQIENRLCSLGQSEVPSRTIGEMVMEALRALDSVAYVRFASVYRSFADVEDYRREVDGLLGRDS